jgi:quinol monooxygenase YgiN
MNRQPLIEVLKGIASSYDELPALRHFAAGESRTRPGSFLMFGKWTSEQAFLDAGREPLMTGQREALMNLTTVKTRDLLWPLGHLERPPEARGAPPRVMVSTTMVAKKDKVECLPAFLENARGQIFKWPGNRLIENGQNFAGPDFFHGYGEWDSLEALDAYMNSPEINDFFEPLKGKLVSQTLDVLDVVAFAED